MIDSRQAEAFLAVAEYRSFAKAAQKLALSLAAVSLRIRALESVWGQRLLVRGKQVGLTPAGQNLLAHLRQVESMEGDLQRALQGSAVGEHDWQSLPVAVNGDSVASWFLPGVESVVREHRLALDITIDDQDHTHALLKSGEVIGCVSTVRDPIRGCVAEPLGVVRYFAVACEPLLAQMRGKNHSRRMSLPQLLDHPAIIFNRKDGLQNAFLKAHYGVDEPDYPRHWVPSTEAYEKAIERGWGWGMVSEQQLAQRGEYRPALAPLQADGYIDVHLFWHHWERESIAAQRLTKAIIASAQTALRQLP